MVVPKISITFAPSNIVDRLNYKTMDELQNIQNPIIVIRRQRVALFCIPTWNVKSSVKTNNNHLIICIIRKVLLSLQRHFF